MIVDCASQYGSPNIYDQHRDMRMDIDNMSYEVIIFVSCFFFFFLKSFVSCVINYN